MTSEPPPRDVVVNPEHVGAAVRVQALLRGVLGRSLAACARRKLAAKRADAARQQLLQEKLAQRPAMKLKKKKRR